MHVLSRFSPPLDEFAKNIVVPLLQKNKSGWRLTTVDRRLHITVTYKGDAHYIGENLNERKAGMKQLMLQYRSVNTNFVRFGFYNSRKSVNYRFAIVVNHSREIMDTRRALQLEGKKGHVFEVHIQLICKVTADMIFKPFNMC